MNRGTAEAEGSEPRRSRHVVRNLFLVLLGVVLLGVVGVSLGLVDAASARASVPRIAGMTPDQASKALAAAQLKDGRAHYFVTRDFPAGRIVSQSPAPGTRLAPGTAVDVQVAAVPRQVTVPDLVHAESGVAEQVLDGNLLRPEVLYAWSSAIETGRVIEQLPRPGDTAATGSSTVLVVSLGPGTSGNVVPRVIGVPLGVARSELASQTLFPDPRSVVATGVPAGTIVDQAPSAGSIVPAASGDAVAVSIAVKPAAF